MQWSKLKQRAADQGETWIYGTVYGMRGGRALTELAGLVTAQASGAYTWNFRGVVSGSHKTRERAMEEITKRQEVYARFAQLAANPVDVEEPVP